MPGLDDMPFAVGDRVRLVDVHPHHSIPIRRMHGQELVVMQVGGRYGLPVVKVRPVNARRYGVWINVKWLRPLDEFPDCAGEGK